MPYIGLGAYAGFWTDSGGCMPSFGLGFGYAGSGRVQSSVDGFVLVWAHLAVGKIFHRPSDGRFLFSGETFAK